MKLLWFKILITIGKRILQQLFMKLASRCEDRQCDKLNAIHVIYWVMIQTHRDSCMKQALASTHYPSSPTNLRHQSTSYKALDRKDVMSIAVSCDCWCLHYLSNKTFESVSSSGLAEYRKCHFWFDINPNLVCFESCKDELMFSIKLRISTIEVKDN